jgi:CheY-like chemotaxis protein
LARKILLADDSVTAQNMGRRILSDAGYEVITVNNGSAALKKIAEQKPDLIVLDVYMPGYSGLEVCQRLKEMPETTRIPVLLSVGKLEPFKPDEARRVRADAFIVKPFEASELLTALTKLEDKIVPQARPQGPSRFARALAAVEQSETGDRFGDTEKGWKNRLIIPSATAKPHESEAEVAEVASTLAREAGRDEHVKPAEPQGFERPIPGGLPTDITPEEVAAIAAAAAAFGKPEEPIAQPEAGAEAEPVKADVVVSQGSVAEAPAATLASAPEAEAIAAPDAHPPAAEVHVAPEAVAPSEAGKTSESPAVTESPAATAGTDSAKTTPEAAAESEKPAAADAEVLAAIASLAPTNGHDAGSVQSSEQDATTSGAKSGDIPVAAAVVAAQAELAAAIGPRWIAEPIPVGEDESALILEREMEKAYAAFAAAEVSRTSLVAAAAAGMTFSATASAMPSIESVSAAAGESKSQESAPETAMAAAEVASQTAAAPQRSASLPPAEEEDHQREAELAAAWANWRQIRESIVGSQLTSQIADAAAAEFKGSRREERTPAISEEAEVAPEPANDESSSTSSADSTAIASIVDSVLAELKPKLVEEIARKMSNEKQKKKKKKE